MTYNTPELLLVGAAQHLVLGLSPAGLAECILRDNPNNGTYQETSDW